MAGLVVEVSGSYFDGGERNCDDVVEKTEERFPESRRSPECKLLCRPKTSFTLCLSIHREPPDETRALNFLLLTAGLA
jgi:hypothetical protein